MHIILFLPYKNREIILDKPSTLVLTTTWSFVPIYMA